MRRNSKCWRRTRWTTGSTHRRRLSTTKSRCEAIDTFTPSELHKMQNPEVIVVGGGPAGSTTSTLLAQHGHRVQLFERERFPRFHIGESLIPETYWVLQ